MNLIYNDRLSGMWSVVPSNPITKSLRETKTNCGNSKMGSGRIISLTLNNLLRCHLKLLDRVLLSAINPDALSVDVAPSSPTE